MLIQYKQHAYDLTTAPLMAELCCQTPPSSEYLIVDPAGTSGDGLTWLQKADIISFSKKQMNKKMVYYL